MINDDDNEICSRLAMKMFDAFSEESMGNKVDGGTVVRSVAILILYFMKAVKEQTGKIVTIDFLIELLRPSMLFICCSEEDIMTIYNKSKEKLN